MKDNSSKLRRPWPMFLAGIATVLLILGGVILYREYDGIGKPEVLQDGFAHVRCLERGVPIPNSAKDVYYFYLEGFVNYREYFAFTVAPSEAHDVAQACAKRVTTNPTFTSGKESAQWFVNGGPGHDHSKWTTPLWDLNTVTNGELFEKGQLFVLVDTGKSRVYIATWGDFAQSEKFAFGIPRLSSGMAWYLSERLKEK